MINKSLRNSSPKFGTIVNYVLSGMDELNQDNRWVLFHNMQKGYERAEIIEEFEENAEYMPNRKTSRKRVYSYHEILSFSEKSSKHLTNDKLQSIARKYLKLRDPEQAGKAICAVHYEKKHTHLHFIISSNHIGSDRSSDMRMDNKRYFEIRKNMERFTLQHYPELIDSTVYLEPEEIKKIVPEKFHEQIRAKTKNRKDFGKQTKKEHIATQVCEILDRSSSQNDFIKNLENCPHIQPYFRHGILTGVVFDNKKYRLKTLGIELLPERLNVLSRLNELEKIKTRKDRSSEQER